MPDPSSKETLKGAKIIETGGGDASPYADPVAKDTVKGEVLAALGDDVPPGTDPKPIIAKHGMAKDTVKGKEINDQAEAWTPPV